MSLTYDASYRGWSQGSAHGGACLGDKFEVIKEIGDGSFGSVALARVRGAGAHIARRGTLVAIKTMKKTFDSFAPCLELREIIFLRTLPNHVHLVPALDIFLDPLTKKLHIAMEYMDGNLYQLMKARDHKPFDGSSVKSILYQILAGLEHIHEHEFFHRDIKPENILVSVSAREDLGSAFKRYSQLVTPPSTPPTYSIKLADFGLARETHSKLPYTTYVSTRWYRAPEVLLRAGEYSSPVDIWALGAMAVEVATLKPLFPGGNEVDQVWRVCEIMGSPGNWVNRSGQKVGGGEWKEGVKLAQKLGFSFPKMAPHTMDTILVQPQWPAELAHFVTWCLLWDPKARPTCSQAMQHPYFTDAVDPLRPKSSRSGLLGRKHSDLAMTSGYNVESHSSLTSKTSSWFRRSLVARESAPAVPQVSQHQTCTSAQAPPSPRQSPLPKPEAVAVAPQVASVKAVRPVNPKRATWTTGMSNHAAPMPILPSIRPVSPLSNTVHAQAQSGAAAKNDQTPRKIGRQLSVASHGDHYADQSREQAEAALTGRTDLVSPSIQKESFFSHLRKRARRLSGRHQLPLSPKAEDPVGCSPWQSASGSNSKRNSVAGGDTIMADKPDFADLDRALQNVRYSLDQQAAAAANGGSAQLPAHAPVVPPKPAHRSASNPVLRRHSSLNQGRTSPGPGLHNSRSTRRVAQKPSLGQNHYETPDEQEELLDEALASAQAAMVHLDQQKAQRPIAPQQVYSDTHAYTVRSAARKASTDLAKGAYPTPSASANRNSMQLSGSEVASRTKPIEIGQQAKARGETSSNFPWPTPPYDENEWAAAAAASIAAAGDHWR